MDASEGIETKMEEQEGFTTVASRRKQNREDRKAREALARAAANARIPGAIWSDVPLSRCHLPGIPYSYYDEEIVMIRQRTAELIERQRAELRAQARAQRRNQYVPEGGHWYTLEHGQVQPAGVASQWQGIDE